jgi:hypothetical protein
MPKLKDRFIRVIHLEKDLSVPAAECFSCFSTIQKLRKWYDQEARMTSFRVGGEIAGNYFPGYQIVALVKNQMVVQKFNSVIDGIGIWSFVQKGSRSRLVFDHVAEENRGDEYLARLFHWQGLVENLGALCEHRPLAFEKGKYVFQPLPRGIRYATCPEFVAAMKTSSSDSSRKVMSRKR